MSFSLHHITNNPAVAVDPGTAIGDPLQHLIACHERIEERLQILERVIPHLRADAEDRRLEARDALERAVQFLDAMGALHTQDEEVSVFPRVLVGGGDDAQLLLELVTLLEAQHREKEEVLRKLQGQIRALPPAPAMPSESQVSHLESSAYHLADLYRPHIMVENQRLIPLSADHLTEADLEAIRQEMRSRRGL